MTKEFIALRRTIEWFRAQLPYISYLKLFISSDWLTSEQIEELRSEMKVIILPRIENYLAISAEDSEVCNVYSEFQKKLEELKPESIVCKWLKEGKTFVDPKYPSLQRANVSHLFAYNTELLGEWYIRAIADAESENQCLDLEIVYEYFKLL